MGSVVFFTDGSCLPTNPGPGGWAYLRQAEGQAEQLESGGVAHTTNNRMEMTAAIEALKTMPPGASLSLYTDSEYLKLGITVWIHNWKRKGRMNGHNSVKNSDLWLELDELNQKLNVDWHWVRAHNNHPDNERVDQAAREEATKIAMEQGKLSNT